MLESMARDLAHNFQKRSMGMVQKPPGAPGQTPQVAAQNESATQPQDQIAQQQRLMAQKQLEMNQAQQQRQQPQPQQSVPAPLNATNLEKNSQALKNQKAGSKGYKAPVAPTTAQPPFPFGASSPQGLPNYGAKVKDMNLQIPPRKRAKLDKQDGQGSQTATPSPKTATKTSPPQDVKRPPEPPKPVLLCKEPECQGSTVGYASEEALQQHINEEHVKPKENPLKFCSENLALALGLEADGSVKDAMSRTASKQGQTPGNFGLGTPKSQDGVGMKRSMSSQSKMPSVKGAGSPDSWAGSSFDSQSLLTKLGLPNGINSVVFDPNTIRSLTPKDTPESSKDSGSSEPNSDILEAPVPDFDVNWHTLDTDVLLDMNNSNFGVDFSTFDKSNTGTMDPTLLMDPTSPGEPDWSDVKIDFNAPFRFDTGRFHMDVN